MRLPLSILILCATLRPHAETAPTPAQPPAKAAAAAPAATAQVTAPATAPVAPAADSSKRAAPAEVIETSEPAPAQAPASPAPEMSKAASVAADSVHLADSVAALRAAAPGPLEIRNTVLERLTLSGTTQLKAFYHNFSADSDAAKRLSLNLRRFKLGLEGAINDHAGFKGEFLMDGNNRSFGTDDAYLYWRLNDWVGFRGGKQKRPFSQEALQSSKSLYTVERGELYHDFLANTTGYAYYDLGLVAYGGFEEEGVAVGYEFGVFDGKQSENGYAGQQDEKQDAGFLAKDVVARLTASPLKTLKVEAAVSTKAADDKRDSANFAYAVNTAYEVGADLLLGHLRLLGEVSWGDNHKKRDSLIISGSPEFFAFYLTGVWREEYSRGRASELVLKMEGLDPDFAAGSGKGTPNDGLLRYTVGCNYFFTPAVSVLADYQILQPVTKIAGKDKLTHDLDLMWRISF